MLHAIVIGIFNGEVMAFCVEESRVAFFATKPMNSLVHLNRAHTDKTAELVKALEFYGCFEGKREKDH